MIRKTIGLWIVSFVLAESQFCYADSAKELETLHKLYKQQQKKLEQQSYLLKQQEQYLKSLERRFNNLSQKLQQRPQKAKPQATATAQTKHKQTTSVARQSPATNSTVKPVGQAHKNKVAIQFLTMRVLQLFNVFQQNLPQVADPGVCSPA